MNTLDPKALVERQGQCVLLANVLTMTPFMLERARKDEWELVTELEGQRRELLNECFATAVSPEHSEIFSEALAAMLHLNEELMSQLKTARDQVADEGNAQVRNLEAAGEYQKMHLVR